MQNTTLDLGATAKITSPKPTSTQESNAAPSTIDPDLLKLLDDLVVEVKKCAAHALGWLIMIGIRLREYRDGLEADDWNQLFQSGRLPFSARKAQMLIRVGGHRILADMNRVHQLPES